MNVKSKRPQFTIHVQSKKRINALMHSRLNVIDNILYCYTKTRPDENLEGLTFT